MYTLKKN
jgi:hypothetical protein